MGPDNTAIVSPNTSTTMTDQRTHSRFSDRLADADGGWTLLPQRRHSRFPLQRRERGRAFGLDISKKFGLLVVSGVQLISGGHSNKKPGGARSRHHLDGTAVRFGDRRDE